MLSILFIDGCKDANLSENCTVVKIQDEKTIKASDFIDDMDYIILETSDSCVLAELRNIKISNDLLYITDVVFKGIYVFNLDGELINKFSSFGNGPGEYSSLDDFIIDEEKKTIEILDRVKKEIFIYDLGTFTFRKSIPLPITFCFAFTKIQNVYYFQTNNARNRIGDKITNSEIIAYNIKTKDLYPLFDKVLPETENQNWEFFNVFTETSTNEVFVSLAWHDKIYKIKNEEINCFISLDKGSRGFPNEIINGMYDEKMRFLNSVKAQDRIHFFKLIMKNEISFILVYGKGYPPKVCHYININSGPKVLHTDNIVNDFLPFTYENLEFFKEEQGMLMSVIYPFYEKDNQILLSYFDATIKDNPILLMFKLKENEI